METVNGRRDGWSARSLCHCALVAVLGLMSGCSSDPVAVDRAVPLDLPSSQVLSDLQALGLESLPAPIRTYYSPGYRERAEMLQAWLRSADTFFQRRLHIAPTFDLAVLNPEHWAVIFPGPYGVPFYTEAPHVVVMPAILELAVPTQIYTASRVALPASAAADLAAVGVSYEDAVLQVVDLIGFHEVGHVYGETLGYHAGNTPRWLRELLATYAAYSYLQVERPSSITVWDALSEAVLGFVEPTSLSLDDFNEQGARGLGPATYGWYQSHFNLRATDVLHQRPRATWFKQLAGTGIDRDTRDLATSELMRRLRGFHPSFTEWADAAGLQYR